MEKNSLMSTLCVLHVSCISGLESQPKMSLKISMTISNNENNSETANIVQLNRRQHLADYSELEKIGKVRAGCIWIANETLV